MAPGSPETRHGGGVEHIGAELRGEASRKYLLEGEAVGVVKHLVPGRLIRHDAVFDSDFGAAGGSVKHAVGRVQQVADEEDVFLVGVRGPVHAAAGVRVTEIEPAFDLLAHVVPMAVDLHLVVDRMPCVDPQLDLVGHFGRPPDLRGFTHSGIASRDDPVCVVALDAAVGWKGVAELAGQVDKPLLAKRKPDVGRHGVHVPIPRQYPAVYPVARIAQQVPARLDLDRTAGPIVPEDKIHHPCNGVRTVLSGRTVAQHLGLFEGQPGNERNVRALGAVGEAVAVPGNDRSAMATLAVDQDQGMIGRKAAQVCRARKCRCVTDGLNVDVERRHHVAQQVGEIRTPLIGDIAAADYVDGHHRFGHRTRLRTTTYHSHCFEENNGFVHGCIEPGRFPIHHGGFHNHRLVSDKAKIHHMGSCRRLLDHVIPVDIGKIANVQCRNGHLHIGQRYSVRIAYGSFKRALSQNRQGGKRQKRQGCKCE